MVRTTRGICKKGNLQLLLFHLAVSVSGRMNGTGNGVSSCGVDMCTFELWIAIKQGFISFALH